MLERSLTDVAKPFHRFGQSGSLSPRTCSNQFVRLMFIAHLPAGYLVARWLSKDQPHRNALIATGLVASVLPDTDLLWFYLVDQRQTPHHAYVFNWPLFWVACAAGALSVAWFMKWGQVKPFIGITLACLLLDMVLDSVAAEISWLQPFADYEVNLVSVPARFDWWVWSFVFHWTFLLEITTVLAAGITLWRDKRHDLHG